MQNDKMKWLEKILDLDEEMPITILPNGEIALIETSRINTGTLKPLTFREDLGGEYGIPGAVSA